MPQVSIPAGGTPIATAWATEVANAINGMFSVGTVILGFFTGDPTDHLLLDGRNLSRSGIYAALYAAVGPYGGPGNGSTTWDLPNMANRMPMHPGPSPAVAVGGTGGSKDAVLVQHTHTANQHTHSGTSGNENSSLAHTHATDSPGGHQHGIGGDTGIRYIISHGAGVDFTGASPTGGTHTPTTISAMDVSGNHSHTALSNGPGAHQHNFSTGNSSNTGMDSPGVSATNANLPPYMGLAFAVKYR